MTVETILYRAYDESEADRLVASFKPFPVRDGIGGPVIGEVVRMWRDGDCLKGEIRITAQTPSGSSHCVPRELL
jgi:hypothetical protein